MRKMLLITQSEISSGMDFIEKGLTEFEIGEKAVSEDNACCRGITAETDYECGE